MSAWVTGDPRAGSQTLRRITSEQNGNNPWPAVGQQMTAEEGKRWRAAYSTPPTLHPSINPSPLSPSIHSARLIDRGKWEHSVVKIIHFHQGFQSHVTLCSSVTCLSFYRWSLMWLLLGCDPNDVLLLRAFKTAGRQIASQSKRSLLLMWLQQL